MRTQERTREPITGAKAAAASVACAAALLFPSAGGVQAAPRASWHHGRSPYRASFALVSPPNHPSAGVAVSVPTCGLGREEGGDLVAYDQSGSQLPLLPLGRSVDNQDLAVLEPRPGTKSVHVYFGSGMKAPVARNRFTPSLLLDVRTLSKGAQPKNWKDVQAELARSKRIGRVFVDKIEQSYNPVSSDDACILVFEGCLKASRAERQTLMLVSDDAGYLLVDDTLVVERNGRHWARDAVRGESRGGVSLTAGVHPVRCVVVDFGGELMALVARWHNARKKAVLPPAAFVQPGTTRLERVEGRYRDSPVPAFWYKPVSYLSYTGAQYTETEFGTYNGENADWIFQDGGRFDDVARFRRVLVGLDDFGVQVTQGKAVAKGRVVLNELPPKRLRLKSGTDFDRYARHIAAEAVDDLDATHLRSYMHLLSYRELNPSIIPLCQAILKKRKVPEPIRLATALDLGRVAGPVKTGLAEKAYGVVFGACATREDGGDRAREAVDFSLFGARDYELAKSRIERLARARSPRDKLVVELMVDLALQQADVETARERLETLLSGRDFGETQRVAAVRGNALRQRFFDLLERDFVGDALKVLYEWSEVSPVDRTNGSLALARSRMWQRLGWVDGALGELDGAILLDPLLPNLPDIELERGLVLRRAGQNDQANEVMRKIIREYPNHPAAERAKELLR